MGNFVENLNLGNVSYPPGFFPNKQRQTLLCNRFYIYYVSFDVYEVKFGGVVWVWRVVKDYGIGGWWNPMSFILSIS